MILMMHHHHSFIHPTPISVFNILNANCESLRIRICSECYLCHVHKHSTALKETCRSMKPLVSINQVLFSCIHLYCTIDSCDR
jgi:hypothetical protein